MDGWMGGQPALRHCGGRGYLVDHGVQNLAYTLSMYVHYAPR